MSKGIIDYDKLVNKAKQWRGEFNLSDAINCGIRDNKFYINYHFGIDLNKIRPYDEIWRPSLSLKQINIFKAFEKFKKEHPDGKIVFWDVVSKQGIEFPVCRCYTMNN